MTTYEKYQNHPFLPLYPEGNVPFDEGTTIWDKLILIPYPAPQKTFPQTFLLYETGSEEEEPLSELAEEVWKPAGFRTGLHGFSAKQQGAQGFGLADSLFSRSYDQVLAWMKLNGLR